MASSFNNADVAVGTSRTLVYQAAAGVTAILFSGLVSNVDSTNRQDHYVTLERRKADGTTYFNKFKAVPIAYGGALPIPKIVLKPGEALFASGDVLNALELSIEVVERS